ncbi:MAG TPA: cytochrome c oxidase assembly protein [Ktedonobacterales bacterium]|jgi:putative membrane protein|nr:cytochrome c oxidase assembly protein [Ktedonobacterales bacterium]
MHQSPSPLAWAFDPAAILFLIALAVAYFIAIGPLRTRYQPDEPVARKHIGAFVAGWVILALCIITPLDTLGRYYLFAAHTIQLFVIITAVAPLLMISLPDTLGRRLLPTRRLREAGRDPLFTVVAVVLFNMLILIWHAGPIYEAALLNTGLHDLQLLTFLIAGILTWWPLLTPADHHSRLSSPLQIVYLAAESLPLDVFGIFTIFAPGPFYQTYADAPRVVGWLSVIADQQVGGGILAVPGNIVDLVLMSLVFFGWVNQIERAQRERERGMYDESGATSAPPEAGTASRQIGD